MDNYFTSFCLLTHIRVTNIQATKIGYANALSLGTNNCKNEDRGHFEQRTLSEPLIRTTARYFKRFARCLNKVERKYIQEQQQNQFHYYNQNMCFVDTIN